METTLGLFAVMDREDSLETRNEIRARGFPRSSSLIVDVIGGRRSGPFLVRGILEALDKQAGIRGEVRSCDFDWSYARAWVATLGIQRLVVLRGHLLARNLVEDLVGFSALLELELVLVVVPQETCRASREALQRWCFASETMAELLEGLKV